MYSPVAHAGVYWGVDRISCLNTTPLGVETSPWKAE